MDDLVKRLSEGEHPVEVSLRPERTIEAFKACLERGYVHIKFTDTRGGTELGVRLDKEACDLGSADFTGSHGAVRLVGNLILNYVPVRCSASIGIDTLTGTGFLTVV